MSVLLLALAAAMFVVPTAQPAGAPGLVAAFAFEETGGASAADSSGSGNTGAISGAVSSASGKFGRALSFDGVNDIVSVADAGSLDLTTGMTLQAWVNPQGADWRTVLLKERPSGLAYALYSSTDTGRPSAEIRASTPAETRGPSALPSGWSHLAATYDGVTLRLYVNGTQVSSQARSGSIEVGTGAVRIGGNAVWGEYFSGLIDELRIYNRALTAAEIQADMTAPIVSPDTQAPTAPGSLAATVAGDDVQLAWTAATDDTAVTSYRVHRSATAGFTPDAGTLIATVGGAATSYVDPDRLTGTWHYRVIAVDAATNASLPSGQASATIGPDSQPPSAPGNLTATVNGDDVRLSWSASSDNVGVSGYRVYEAKTPGFTPGGNTSTLLDTVAGNVTSFIHANQPVGTTNYRIVALDAAGNSSASSAEAAATVAGPNAAAPTAPGNLTATADGDVVHLSWTHSTDDVGVDTYRVYRSTTPGFWPYAPGNWLGQVDGNATSFDDDVNATTGTFYYKVIAHDALFNFSPQSNEVVATLDPDTTPPTVSINNACDGAVAYSEYFDVNVPAFDDRGGVYLRVLVDGVEIWSSGSFPVSGQFVRFEWSTRNTISNGLHEMVAIARDGAGNETTSAPCTWLIHNRVLTVPITSPLDGSTVRGVVTLDADPRADGVAFTTGVSGVAFTANGVALGTTQWPSGFSLPWDTRTLPNGLYTIQAKLYYIDYSNPQATTTIQVTVDNTVPQPTGLAAAVDVDDVQLTWDAAPAGVTGFQLHRSLTAGFTPGGGSMIAALNGSVTSYLDANRPAGTWHYRLVAVDAGVHSSAPSAEVAATVEPDTQAPTAPASLAASVTGDDVQLAWAAAADDRAVTAYRIHRSATAGFTPGAGTLVGSVDGSITSAPDANRPVGTWHYRVIAVDAAGNAGAPSPEANATIVAPPASTGLVAAYGFEETSGNAALDRSGNSNTGTVAGPTRTASGKFGRALSFDGINDIVNIADSSSLDLTTGMTLEAWVRPNATGWRTVLLKERPSGLAYALYGSTDNNRPSTEARTSVTFESRGPAALPAATWSHLAATYDGATLRLYVNGVQISSVPRGGVPSLEVGTGALRLGGNTVWGEYFGGLIDEVRIYNRALSATEIAIDRDTPVGGP